MQEDWENCAGSPDLEDDEEYDPNATVGSPPNSDILSPSDSVQLLTTGHIHPGNRLRTNLALGTSHNFLRQKTDSILNNPSLSTDLDPNQTGTPRTNPAFQGHRSSTATGTPASTSTIPPQGDKSGADDNNNNNNNNTPGVSNQFSGLRTSVPSRGAAHDPHLHRTRRIQA